MAHQLPIESTLDLHAFAPRDVVSVVEEYVTAAAAAGTPGRAHRPRPRPRRAARHGAGGARAPSAGGGVLGRYRRASRRDLRAPHAARIGRHTTNRRVSTAPGCSGCDRTGLILWNLSRARAKKSETSRTSWSRVAAERFAADALGHRDAVGESCGRTLAHLSRCKGIRDPAVAKSQFRVAPPSLLRLHSPPIDYPAFAFHLLPKRVDFFEYRLGHIVRRGWPYLAVRVAAVYPRLLINLGSSPRGVVFEILLSLPRRISSANCVFGGWRRRKQRPTRAAANLPRGCGDFACGRSPVQSDAPQKALVRVWSRCR